MGHCGARSLKRPSLGLGSGRERRVVRSSPALGSELSADPAWDCPPLPHFVHVCLPSLSLCVSLLFSQVNKSLKILLKKKIELLGFTHCFVQKAFSLFQMLMF